jgi:hypothetical protein
VSQFMEVKVAWVQIAADLKCRVTWHLFSSDLLLQTLIKLLLCYQILEMIYL